MKVISMLRTCFCAENSGLSDRGIHVVERADRPTRASRPSRQPFLPTRRGSQDKIGADGYEEAHPCLEYSRVKTVLAARRRKLGGETARATGQQRGEDRRRNGVASGKGASVLFLLIRQLLGGRRSLRLDTSLGVYCSEAKVRSWLRRGHRAHLGWQALLEGIRSSGDGPLALNKSLSRRVEKKPPEVCRGGWEIAAE
jgi:hypothetical protein